MYSAESAINHGGYRWLPSGRNQDNGSPMQVRTLAALCWVVTLWPAPPPPNFIARSSMCCENYIPARLNEPQMQSCSPLLTAEVFQGSNAHSIPRGSRLKTHFKRPLCALSPWAKRWLEPKPRRIDGSIFFALLNQSNNDCGENRLEKVNQNFR